MKRCLIQCLVHQPPPVLVNVNGYEYRNTVGVTGGRHSTAVRDVTGLKGGDLIRVDAERCGHPA